MTKLSEDLYNLDCMLPMDKMSEALGEKVSQASQAMQSLLHKVEVLEKWIDLKIESLTSLSQIEYTVGPQPNYNAAIQELQEIKRILEA